MSLSLVDLPWWGYVLYTLALTHVTIAGVTIYLHRHSAHRALDLHPIASHFFRFWLWLTTGMITKEWTAIHRKHHARVETPDDPHSPQVVGLRKVLLEGSELYRAEAARAETLDKFGSGTPDDWMERNLYTRHNKLGIGLMLVINLVLFGPIGLTIWAVQMLWIPIFAAGVINGVGHYWGYRNFQCEDASTNIVPWGILIGGEELHNNHHAYGSSAKLSAKWYEFDLGWLYIRILAVLGLARVRRVAPRLRLDAAKAQVDVETLQAVITHRYVVMTRYAKAVREAYAAERDKLAERCRGLLDARSLRALKRWLQADASGLEASDRAKLELALSRSKVLETLYAMRAELAAVWERSTESREQLVQRLQEWCRRAEASGIPQLQQFSRQLTSFA
jgi:stearoyl-CoA desaturase (delta-9 desaturase)